MGGDGECITSFAFDGECITSVWVCVGLIWCSCGVPLKV